MISCLPTAEHWTDSEDSAWALATAWIYMATLHLNALNYPTADSEEFSGVRAGRDDALNTTAVAGSRFPLVL